MRLSKDEMEAYCEKVGKYVHDAQMNDGAARRRAYREILSKREQEKSSGNSNHGN